MTEIIEDRLNLREGAKILEKDNLEEAALWCFQHDVFPIGLWLGLQNDDEYDRRLSVSKPILDDYLNIILKRRDNFSVNSNDDLFKKIASDVENVDRYPDGDVTSNGVDSYYRRFVSKERNDGDREYELSVYPYRKIELDINDILGSSANGIDDARCKYISGMFESYFPTTVGFSRNSKYSSREDPKYIAHVDALNLAVRSFVFSNELSDSLNSKKVDDALQMLATWVVMTIGPKIKAEGV